MLEDILDEMKAEIKDLREENEKLNGLLSCVTCAGVGYDGNIKMCYDMACDNYKKPCPLIKKGINQSN